MHSKIICPSVSFINSALPSCTSHCSFLLSIHSSNSTMSCLTIYHSFNALSHNLSCSYPDPPVHQWDGPRCKDSHLPTEVNTVTIVRLLIPYLTLLLCVHSYNSWLCSSPSSIIFALIVQDWCYNVMDSFLSISFPPFLSWLSCLLYFTSFPLQSFLPHFFLPRTLPS